ncbi:MBL fold metallo-hydrolase [Mesoplasma melaleucae]|uniref:MBL fold metallo-hydrolase n=1 Tax=Mesoplasma melaleucae TaxID=81459 RepID=UPI000A00C69E|nr:MBL fold metallo-hydrolase [Mesoplasma melaleucae]
MLINKEDNKAILIDGAYSSDLILDFLDKNNLILTDIFITHFHHDHTVGVDIIALKTGAIIHFHELDYKFLFN